MLGRSLAELPTPALVLDLPAARRNLARMVTELEGLPAALRPHIKVHKCAELARLQVEAGAVGICTATAWEAVAMVDAGIDDVTVANQVVGRESLDALARAGAQARVCVAVDSMDNLADVAAAARRHDVELGVLIEVDVGMDRCGTRSPQQALSLAELAVMLAGVRLDGVMGYEGQCTGELDPARRAEMQREALATLSATVGYLREAGHPCEVVSAGGTCTASLTAADPIVTELQAGTYLVGDVFHELLGSDFELALTVHSSVLSARGTDFVVDAGRKGVGSELVAPRLAGGAELRFINEEHSGFRIERDSVPVVGAHVALQPGYAPLTVNLYDAMYVVEDGIVLDRWRVRARHACPPWALNPQW
ncbi:MAG: alanine racemase [Solirubrobacteraceae bacterium]